MPLHTPRNNTIRMVYPPPQDPEVKLFTHTFPVWEQVRRQSSWKATTTSVAALVAPQRDITVDAPMVNPPYPDPQGLYDIRSHRRHT
jgi:hypothetical protein